MLAIAFVVFRVLVRRTYLTHGRSTRFATFLQYVAILSWVCFGYLSRPRDWPDVHVGPALRIAGWILFAGGAVLTLALIVALGILRSHGRQVDVLTATGAYALSRNPQVVAFCAAMVGYGLLWPSWRNAGVVAVVAALAHMMVLTEEEHLRAVFGEEYERYCRRVPRYLGRAPS